MTETPIGAIVNGREFARRLEANYDFQDFAGSLVLCSDWDEFKACFEYLAEAAALTRPQPAPATDPLHGVFDKKEMLATLCAHRRENKSPLQTLKAIESLLTAPTTDTRAETLRGAIGAIGKVNVPIGSTAVIWAAQDAIKALIDALPPAQAITVAEAAKVREVLDMVFSTYRAKNGREVGIEDDNGEKVWLLPDDGYHMLRALSEQEATSAHSTGKP